MTQADSVHSTPPTNAPVAQTRRGFLGRAMTALAVGGAATTTIIAAAKPVSAAMIDEYPAVVALGERIDPLLHTYRAALIRLREARATAQANCPAVPEEIVCKGSQWMGCAEQERDVVDKVVWPAPFIRPDGKPGMLPPRNVLSSKRVQGAIANGNLYCDRRTSFGKQIAKLIDTAKRYETEREAAIEQSGLPTAQTQLYLAARDIEQLAYEAADIKPQTIAGVLVQARALSAYAEAEIELDHHRGRSAQIVGAALAETVFRLSSQLRHERRDCAA
jgi:hypothetical protein